MTTRILRNTYRSLAAAGLTSIMLAAGPGASAVPGPNDPDLVGFAENSTSGAYANAAAFLDNGMTVRVYVKDTRADGVCAHAALRWRHNNGNDYYDYGTYVCGQGKTARSTKGTRNQTQYRWVDLLTWVDGRPVAVARLWSAGPR